MRVQVINSDFSGTCSRCGDESIVTKYTVFIGADFIETPSLCVDCVREHSIAELAAVKALPTPPTRRMQKTSRRREVEIAEDVGGRRQPGSGSTPFMKGDVRKKGEFRIEHKDCYGLEFKVHRTDLLDKIRAECSRGEHPVVVVTFRSKTTHENLEAWAMVPYETWLEKTDAAGKHR